MGSKANPRRIKGRVAGHSRPWSVLRFQVHTNTLCGLHVASWYPVGGVHSVPHRSGAHKLKGLEREQPGAYEDSVLDLKLLMSCSPFIQLFLFFLCSLQMSLVLLLCPVGQFLQLCHLQSGPLPWWGFMCSSALLQYLHHSAEFLPQNQLKSTYPTGQGKLPPSL